MATIQNTLESLVLTQMDEHFSQVPQFFCSLDAIRQQAKDMQMAFSGHIAYAVKANPRPEIIKTLRQEGITHFDVASINEAKLIRHLIPDATILFNNPVKTPAEITVAAEQLGVCHYTVQSREEIDKVLQYTPSIARDLLEIAVRIKAPASTSARINHSMKFGVQVEQVESLLMYLETQGVNHIFLSVHIGSDNPSVSLQPYEESLQHMYVLAKRYPRVKALNLGGGFPAQFYPAPKPDVPAMLRALSACFDNKQRLNYYIEPGLSLVGNSTVLVTPIVEIDPSIPAIYIRDGIYSSYYCYHVHQHPIEAYLYRRNNERLMKLEGKPIAFQVYGQTCDGGDVLTMKLPRTLQKHDMICVETAGAYMGSVASQFNGFSEVEWNFY